MDEEIRQIIKLVCMLLQMTREEREEMERTAGAAIKWVNDYKQKQIMSHDSINDDALDTVSVVRCKDCMFCYHDSDRRGNIRAFCELWEDLSTSDDSFCSYGKKEKTI